MRIIASITDAKPVMDRVWVATLDVELSRESPMNRSELPTMIVVKGVHHLEATGDLQFDYRSLEILNRGDDTRALIFDAGEASATGGGSKSGSNVGDLSFLRQVGTLSGSIDHLGRDLLARIREIDPEGDLEERGRRFVNRPDNFVALEPQKTLNQFIVHVRGLIRTPLKAVATQRGYTAFKVASDSDLAEAGRVLGLAKRRF